MPDVSKVCSAAMGLCVSVYRSAGRSVSRMSTFPLPIGSNVFLSSERISFCMRTGSERTPLMRSSHGPVGRVVQPRGVHGFG